MKQEFTLNGETKKIIEIMAEIFNNKKTIFQYTDGNFAFVDTESSQCVAKIGFTCGFELSTLQIDIIYSILKNSEEAVFIKTNKDSFSINGITLTEYKYNTFSNIKNGNDYHIFMTKEDFNNNFCFSDYGRITKIVNNKLFGYAFLVGNKNIKFGFFDYITICSKNINGDVNKERININFRHDITPYILSEQNVDMLRKLINYGDLYFIFYSSNIIVYNEKFELTFMFLPQRNETAKCFEFVENIINSKTEIVTLEKKDIFLPLKLIKDSNIVNVTFSFETGYIKIETSSNELLKIRNKNINFEKTIEFSVYNLFTILNELEDDSKITISESKITEDDEYIVITNNKNNKYFVFLG